MNFKEIDKGLRKIVGEMNKMHESFVKVGFLENSKQHEKTKLTVAQVAVANEYGIPEKNIPSRPFMRMTIDKNADKYAKRKQDLVKAIYDGKMTVSKALKSLGVEVKGDIQKEIRDGEFAPNSPVTIKIKGSAKPLIDSGQLRQSVQFEVTEKSS